MHRFRLTPVTKLLTDTRETDRGQRRTSRARSKGDRGADETDTAKFNSKKQEMQPKDRVVVLAFRHLHGRHPQAHAGGGVGTHLGDCSGSEQDRTSVKPQDSVNSYVSENAVVHTARRE